MPQATTKQMNRIKLTRSALVYSVEMHA